MTDRLTCRAVCFERELGGRSIAILKSVSADFDRPGISIVRGDSGAGKTTLLHLLGGLLRPTTGEILLNSEPISRWTATSRDRWRKQTGFMFQTPRLLPELSLFDNTLLPLIPLELSLRDAKLRVTEALDRVGFSEAFNVPAGLLSGGEIQRAALARAIVGRPDWLFADEPTAHQDERGVMRIAEILEALAATGSAIIVSSHDSRLNERIKGQRNFELAQGELFAIP